MRRQQDPLLAFRVEMGDQVGHRHQGAVERMGRAESLQLDLPAELLEMLHQIFCWAAMPGVPLDRDPRAQSCLRYS